MLIWTLKDIKFWPPRMHWVYSYSSIFTPGLRMRCLLLVLASSAYGQVTFFTSFLSCDNFQKICYTRNWKEYWWHSVSQSVGQSVGQIVFAMQPDRVSNKGKDAQRKGAAARSPINPSAPPWFPLIALTLQSPCLALPDGQSQGM